MPDETGFLGRDGILARWLTADCLAALCREVYDVLREKHGITRLLIVAQRAGSPAEWAGAPDDESAETIEEWFEKVARSRSPEWKTPSPDAASGAEGTAPALVPPHELGFVAQCRVDVSAAVSYAVYWRSAPGEQAADRSEEEGFHAGGPLWRALEIALCNLARLERVRELSHIDTLTGIFNRRHFNLRLTEELDRARRFNRPLSLLIADLDGFKALNDSRGHQMGDIVLRYVGQSIRHAVRSIDILCRLGGDEFAVLMPDTDQERCAVLAERLRETIATRTFAVGGRGEPVSLRLSLGGAVFPIHSDRADRLLWCADMALLEAKRRGGDQVVFFDPSYCAHLKMPLRSADDVP